MSWHVRHLQLPAVEVVATQSRQRVSPARTAILFLQRRGAAARRPAPARPRRGSGCASGSVHLDAVLAPGVLEPGPEIVGEGAGDVEVEDGPRGGSSARRWSSTSALASRLWAQLPGVKARGCRSSGQPLASTSRALGPARRSATRPSLTSVIAQWTSASASRRLPMRNAASSGGQVRSHSSGPSQSAVTLALGRRSCWARPAAAGRARGRPRP